MFAKLSLPTPTIIILSGMFSSEIDLIYCMVSSMSWISPSVRISRIQYIFFFSFSRTITLVCSKIGAKQVGPSNLTYFEFYWYVERTRSIVAISGFLSLPFSGKQ